MNVQGIVDYNTFFNAVAFVTGDADFFTESNEYVSVLVNNIPSTGGISVTDALLVNGVGIKNFQDVKRPDDVESGVFTFPVNSTLEHNNETVDDNITLTVNGIEMTIYEASSNSWMFDSIIITNSITQIN